MSKENPRSHSGPRAWPGRSSPHPPGESTQNSTVIIHTINITICWVESTVTAWLGTVVFLSTVNGFYCWGEWLGTPMEIKVIFVYCLNVSTVTVYCGNPSVVSTVFVLLCDQYRDCTSVWWVQRLYFCVISIGTVLLCGEYNDCNFVWWVQWL